MSYLFGFLLTLFLVAAVLAALVNVPAYQLASFVRMAGPALLTALGGGLVLIGRAGAGIPLAVIGITMLLRNRSVSQAGSGGAGRKSTVRSAMFEMELDHESGELDGAVLTGEHEGRRLSQLSEDELLELLQATRQDGESAALLEAYLDRRIAGWRENAQSHPGAGQGAAPGTGAITKEEAYQILGLAPGAGPKDVRDAHRRLMKRLHPDSGGSTFLATKINQAKEILLG